jgi:drug/metabolite transporter (DMT)-like permease
MQIVVLTMLAMFAFAANSVLTRMAIDGGYIDPSGFAIIRVAAGALVLGMILSLRSAGLPLLRRNRVSGAISLAVYVIGFSLAYLTLDAGLGALILFGVVQITMFAHSTWAGVTPSRRQLIGASVAFVGLLLVLWPGPGGGADLIGAILMIAAGIGWAIYSIIGRNAQDPLADTAANFLLCLPIVLVLLAGTGLTFSFAGAGLAILCGGLTSGLGYALWYRVLPLMQASVAAVVQLSVPIIAIIAGAFLLGESVGWLLAIAATLVVGGIALALSAQSVQADHS